VTANFWVEQAGDDSVPILSPAAIERMNRETFSSSASMVRLADCPTRLSADELHDRIRAISRRPDSPYLFANGAELTADDFARFESNLNLDAIGKTQSVRFGLVTQRADMRTYPTSEPVYKPGKYSDLDRFQENGLFPADWVAVLHQSRDREWLLVQSYNYLAWTRAAAIAVGTRDAILEYKARPEFVVVTGDKVACRSGTDSAELQLDMGVCLPLATDSEQDRAAKTQGADAGYVVVVPRHGSDGQLQFGPAMIAATEDVTRGFLPYTARNLLAQSFKFLGERYGWGHSLNARDCTGLVAEVYKTFGIYLPRNSDEQSQSGIGQSRHFSAGDSIEARLSSLQSLEVGDLIYTPGHVMMYIGDRDGEPYVIHSYAGLRFDSGRSGQAAHVRGGVEVSPLKPLKASNDKSYVETISTIKKIR
jgi:hypothetical protein